MNKRNLLAILFFLLFATSYGQNLPPGCSGALPFCAGSSSTGISFPNSTNVPSPGNNSCLGSQPNAAWYYLQISQSGNLIFTIRQFNNAGNPIDVDFIAYGPFVTPSCGASNLNSTTQLPNPGGCSFSAAAVETMIINNAVVGQYYMVIMTNFANQPGTITLAQTGGTGATSCDIVCPLTIAGGGVSDCRDNILTANYLNSAQVGTTFTWTHQSSATAPVTTIPSTSGPNFVAGPPRSNNSTRTTLAYGVGTYCVTARSPGCSSTQTAVCTTINPGVPVPFHPPITITACNNSTFDLTQNTSVLLQGLPGSASNYRVRYNLNATNAQTNISPIPTSQQTVFPGTQGQIIYATVWDVSGTYCYAVAQFTLSFVVCAFSTTNTGPICAGGTFNLSATDPGVGPVTYTWAGPNGFTATGANVSNVPTPTGTPPFSYVCTATPSTVGVAPLTSTTIVTVNPIPVATATAVSNSICTGSITDITIGSNVSGTTFNWTSVETNATGSSSGTGTNIAQTLTTSGNTVGTIDYTITLTANGCNGTPIHSIISVKPLPVAVATPTPATICSGSTSNILLTSTPVGATFAWTAFQTDASGASAASGSTIAQVLSSPGNFVGSVDYTITPTLNSCVGLPIHSIMTINPTPVAVATPATTTICSGTATNIPLTSLVTGTTFAWTVVQNNVSGATAGNGTSIAETLTATTANPGSVVYTITPTANGCVGLPITVTITVTPLPTAAISYPGTPFCTSLTAGQAVTLTGTAAYTGGVFSSTTGLTIDATTGAITPSTSTSGNYVVTYTIAANAGCSVVIATTNIVITKVPTATISYAGSPFCSTLTTGQAVTITGTDAYTGGTYSSTAGLTIDATSGAITPSTSTAGNYVVTYTIPASAGCSSVTSTASVVVNLSATASILYAGTPYCSGTTSANVTLTGTAGGTYSATTGLIINPTTGAVDLSSPAGSYTVTYTIAATGGCAAIVVTTPITINLSSVPVTGFSYTTPVCKNGSNPVVIPLTGFTAGGSYSSTPGLSINNSTGVIDLDLSTPGSYTITYTVPATTCGPLGTSTTSIVITALPTAAITYTGTPFCTSLTSGQAVTLTGTSAFAGGSYSSTTGLTINSTTGAITPSTSTPGNYVVTYTAPASAGCASVPVTTNVVITALPTATITYAGTPFCTTLTTGQSITLTGTGGYTGGTYSGTAGLTIDATTGAITPSTSTPGNHTITYTIAAAAGCAPVTITTTIVVTKIPTAAITYAGTPFCTSLTSGQTVILTGTDAYTGGSYSSTTGLTINSTTGAITPSTSTPGNYVVTYTAPASAGCASVPVTTNVVITALPTATITYAGTPFCTTLTSSQAVTLTGTGGYTGGTYNGTAGLIIDATTGAISPSTSTPGNHTITYTIAAAAGCAQVTATTTIVITALPTAAITYAGTPFCTSLTTGQVVALTGTNAYPGGAYSSTTGLTVNSSTGTIIPSTSTPGNYVVTYTAPASAGCASVPANTNVVITALPTATITYAGTPFCTTLTSSQAVTLTGTGGYSGGTYSGTAGLTINVTTGAITPSTSTPGNHTITYTIAAAAGCAQVIATTTIVLTNALTVNILYAGTPFCNSLTVGQPVTLTGTSTFTGGTFSSSTGLIVNATTGEITPSTSTVGNYVVTYTAPANSGCSSVPATTNVVITALPTATITYAGSPFCSNSTTTQAVTLTGTGGYTGGTYSGTTGLTINASTGAITPSSSTSGNHTITYTIPAALGCAQVTTTTTIVITALPTAAITYAGTPFCTSLTTGQAVTLTGTDAYTGGTYSSTTGLTINSTTGAIIPSTSTPGNYVVTYTAPASAGCPIVPVTTNVAITALPTATITYAGTPFCTTLTTGQAVTLTGTGGYTGGTYSGTAGLTVDATTGAITPSTSTPGNHTITYTIPAALGCAQVITSTNIIVNPIPIATATPSAVTICSLDTTNIALTSNAIGTTYVWTAATTNVTGASSASGNAIVDALTVAGNTPGTVVYTITPSGSGCTGLPITATVTVNPLPIATISGTSSICYNSSSLINFTGTPNATVTYTVNGGANQTTTLDNLGTGSVSTGNLIATTTYQLVSVLAAGIPACSQTQSGSVVVTVIPVPLVTTVVSSPTICSGQPTGISLSSNVATATYNWTVTQAGVSGASAGNGSIISQVLTTTGGVPGTATYSIMANEGTCQGPATPITITVNPIPVVTPSTVLQSICSGSVSPVQLTSNVLGTVFNWNVVQTNVTGASNGSGNTIAQVLTTTSNNVGEAVYSVIPTVGGCPGLPILVTVRVNPIPVATANAAVTTICSSSSTNIALTSSVAGTTFSWTVIQTGIFGASSSTGNLIDQVLTTVGNTPGSVVYTITPTINGCSGAPITVTIIVNPTPEVFGSSTSTICSGETPNISLFPSIVATTFAWTVNPINVTGAQAGTGIVINDILTASPNLGTAVYTVTPTANGCSGTPLNITVTVNPAPVPQINDGVICVNQATSISYKNYILDTNLSNATYDFAWYFNGVIINGATNNTYEATQAGIYSVVATNTATGCKSVLTQAVVVASFPGTSVSTTETLAFSDNSIITVDVTGGNASFLYSLDNGPTQSSNVFTDVSPGSHIVTVTDANGCTNLTKLVSIIGYPTYFTPNGDSYHDTWNIVGLGATAKVFIFDRYGKLIKQISPTGEGWDGTLNGEPLMSTDYWFTVDYTEPLTGESKVFRSHFSLKR